MIMIRHKIGLLLGVILLILVIGITTIITAMPSKHRKIEIGTAQKKNLAETVNAEGVVEPNKKQMINIDSSQKVLEVLVASGTEVKEGERILRLDNSDNQYKLDIEEINLKLAERELLKLLKGEKADKKDVEYSFKQAEISLTDAKAELMTAKRMLASDKLLFESGAIAKSQYEESQENVRSKENALALKAMELNRADQSLSNYDFDFSEQVFKLRSNIEIIEENINNLKSKVDADTSASIDGKVVKLDVEKEILIYDMSRYTVNVQLKQQEALYIKEGIKAKIKVKGLDEKEYKGTVIDVDDVAIASKINVKVEIENPDERIKIGYDVEVEMELNVKEGAVVVDFESIIKDNDGKKYIYFVEDNVARRRSVSTGVETSFEVEITEGIIQGDRYVVNPPEKMQKKNSMKIWGWGYESK